jgi:hypothetical protein
MLLASTNADTSGGFNRHMDRAIDLVGDLVKFGRGVVTERGTTACAQNRSPQQR